MTPSAPEFGLNESELHYILSVLSRFKEIQTAKIFGSRAKGNFKPGSDIDLALFGAKVTDAIVTQVHGLLESEGPLPYFIDVLHFVDVLSALKNGDSLGCAYAHWVSARRPVRRILMAAFASRS
jgi:uncharacterized protein